MPESLKASEVNSRTDASVAKQWDRSTPKSEQISDLYGIVDKLQTCILSTTRPDVGPVGRSMAIAKRVGPDFLFIANKHSQKFTDLEQDKTVLLTFQDSSTQNWVSVTGKAVATGNDDPRIKELYNPTLSAWFGDLGDGTHTGKPDDPRMAIIEVRTDYIAYWKSTSTAIGFVKEVALGALTGKVADTGLQRELRKEDIEQMRNTTN